MGDFGLEDEFAPDSELDSDESQQVSAVLNDGSICIIYKNDWIDVLEGTIPPDPWWGYAFQVSRIEDVSIFIKSMNVVSGLYEEIGLDSCLITNVYRHVEKT